MSCSFINSKLVQAVFILTSYVLYIIVVCTYYLCAFRFLAEIKIEAVWCVLLKYVISVYYDLFGFVPITFHLDESVIYVHPPRRAVNFNRSGFLCVPLRWYTHCRCRPNRVRCILLPWKILKNNLTRVKIKQKWYKKKKNVNC